MKRKAVSMLLAVSMVAAMMAGCGSSSDSGGNSSGGGDSSGSEDKGGDDASGGDSSEGGDTSSGGNKLTVWAWDAGFNIPAIQAAADDYKANVNPDFELEIIEQSGSQDIEQQITLAASSGKYDTLPDITLFQDHWIQSYVSDYPDAWNPVGDIDIDWTDFSEEKLSYSTIDGTHYGVPVDNGTVIFAYRVDLLDECGYTIDDMTGISWDEFIKIGEEVYAKTGKYLLCMDGDGNDLIYMMLQAEGESQFKDGVPNITGNDKLVKIVDLIVEMAQKNVCYLANSWSDYTDQVIAGDMVAGVMNGNWIISTIQKVAENKGKWEITSLPTIDGGKEGYASNGGSSLYITANCQNVDLAKDFLAKTFGGSTATYDEALTKGGVITTCISAGESDVYQQGVEYFNDTPIYAKIVEMGANVPVIEQSSYHYTCRKQLAAAVINIQNGGDTMTELKTAEDQLKFEMGIQ